LEQDKIAIDALSALLLQSQMLQELHAINQEHNVVAHNTTLRMEANASNAQLIKFDPPPMTNNVFQQDAILETTSLVIDKTATNVEYAIMVKFHL